MKWVSAFGFEADYEVSDQGHIRHKRPRKGSPPFLKMVPDKDGYGKCTLGRPQRMVVSHRLIWQSFNGKIPDGLVIIHKNGIKSDNRLENLEVCTISYNTMHGFRTLGRRPVWNPQPGVRNGRAKLTDMDVRKIRLLFPTNSDQTIAKMFDVNPGTIWWLRKGVTWRHVD